MPRAVLIVNPFASGVSEERIRAVETVLASAAEVETVLTERQGHATEVARELGRDCDSVFVFAGDGGFNEVLNGIGGQVPVGFIPGGGSSVLPRALGLPRDPADAARQIADAVRQGRTRRISLGRVNGRRFGFGAGVGFDAELVRRVDARGRSRGRRPGDLAYVWTALRLLAERRGRLEPVLEVSGLGRAAFVLVANSDPFTYAGPIPLRVAPEASFELGLDLVAPSRVRARAVPSLLASAVLGRRPRAGLLHRHDVDRVEVRCDRPLPLQVDGEDLGDVEEAVFECERGALTVLA